MVTPPQASDGTRTVLAHVTQAALAHSQLPRSRLSPRVNTQPRANSWAEQDQFSFTPPQESKTTAASLETLPSSFWLPASHLSPPITDPSGRPEDTVSKAAT